MSTANVTTPIPAGVTTAQVLATMHNHDVMIKALCPALVSYQFESGDKNSQATYSVTDKKPIGQVIQLIPATERICVDNSRRHTNLLLPTCLMVSTP